LHWWVPAKRVIRPGHHAPRGGCYEPGVSGIDRRALAQPGLREAFLTGYSEAFRQGSRGVAQDLRVLMRPWGFELGSITVPASIHHGDADTTVPSQHARLFATAIPGAQLHPGYGHFSILGAARQILAPLAA